MAEEITKIKAKRSVIRSSVTKYCKKIANSLKGSDVDTEDLKFRKTYQESQRA